MTLPSALLAVLLTACGSSTPSSPTVSQQSPAPVSAEARGSAVAFAWSEPASLSLPEGSGPLVQTEMTGDVIRRGLSLPVGASAAWTVTVPPAGVLQAEVSGGAALTVLLEADGAVAQVAGQVTPPREAWTALRLDLSRWSGQTVSLRFESGAGGGERVFLAEPALYSSTTEPRQLVLVFIDTLRPDHMGLYGYERDTTPAIDAWAEGAAVFTEARSVAPWTLPAARAALSGRQPESWSDGPALHERLAAEGWATAAFLGGNPYLTETFEMSAGWGLFDHPTLSAAEERVSAARAWLAARPDRDAVALVHLMDAHLPYTEPEAYRSLWAGEPPANFPDQLQRTNLIMEIGRGADKAAFRRHLIDRYDQNLRYLDDALAPLLAETDGAVVALFSDHGEEFWEHDGFEHGHTLYDELLRVPLLLKGPGVAPGRSDAPVSLVDLTPTALALLGMPADETQGRSLLSPPPADRPIAFGRPLYVEPSWGVVQGERKWTTHLGAEVVHDLAVDPAEQSPLAGETQSVQSALSALSALPPLRAAFAEGMGVAAPLLWRVELGERAERWDGDAVITFHHPDGFAAAWLGESPWKEAEMTLDRDGDEVRVTLSGARHTREIYLAPAGDPESVDALEVRADGATLRPASEPPDGRRIALLEGEVLGRSITVTYGVAPVPPTRATSLDIPTMDPELTEALEALGYTEGQ